MKPGQSYAKCMKAEMTKGQTDNYVYGPKASDLSVNGKNKTQASKPEVKKAEAGHNPTVMTTSKPLKPEHTQAIGPEAIVVNQPADVKAVTGKRMPLMTGRSYADQKELEKAGTDKGGVIRYNAERGVNKPYAMGSGISSQGYTVRGAMKTISPEGNQGQAFRQPAGGPNYDRELARDKAKTVLSELKSMPKPNLGKNQTANGTQVIAAQADGMVGKSSDGINYGSGAGGGSASADPMLMSAGMSFAKMQELEKMARIDDGKKPEEKEAARRARNNRMTGEPKRDNVEGGVHHRTGDFEGKPGRHGTGHAKAMRSMILRPKLK